MWSAPRSPSHGRTCSAPRAPSLARGRPVPRSPPPASACLAPKVAVPCPLLVRPEVVAAGTHVASAALPQGRRLWHVPAPPPRSPPPARACPTLQSRRPHPAATPLRGRRHRHALRLGRSAPRAPSLARACPVPWSLPPGRAYPVADVLGTRVPRP
nr:classical arabinogalactan protein 9-like [Lolium perenne]